MARLPLPDGRAVEKEGRRAAHRSPPAERSQVRLQVVGSMVDLDDLELAPVGEPAPAAGRPVSPQRIPPPVRRQPIVGEEDAAARREAAGHQAPERDEGPGRNVGQPEAEEDEIVARGRPPAEEIGADVADARAAHPLPVQRKHLGRGVDARQLRRVRRQALGPQPRAAGQLQDVSPRSRSVEGVGQLVDLRPPPPVPFRTVVEGAAAVEPVVVFRRPGPVVRDLLREDPLLVGFGVPAAHSLDASPASARSESPARR